MLVAQDAQAAAGVQVAEPCWWSKLVRHPWARVLDNVAEILRCGPCGTHGLGYVESLQRICLSDVGKHFTLSMLGRLQIPAPSDSFMSKAEATVSKARHEESERLAALTDKAAADRAIA